LEVLLENPTTVDPTLTVDDVMARHPRAMTVFNEFGIDTCCGAGSTIRDAAVRDGADLARLLEALELAIEVSP
jgi:regulator of cell morphogenesis and NO signaling